MAHIKYLCALGKGLGSSEEVQTLSHVNYIQEQIPSTSLKNVMPIPSLYFFSLGTKEQLYFIVLHPDIFLQIMVYILL